MKLSQKVALNSAAQFGSQLFGALAGLFSVGIAARYLSVGNYGQIIAAMVLVSLFSVLGDFGVTSMAARRLAREPDDARAITASTLVVGIAFTVPTALLIFLISRVAYPGPSHSITRDAVLFMLVPLALKPARGALGAHVVVQQRAYLTSVTSMIARAGSISFVALVAAADLGPRAMAIAYAAGLALDDLFVIAVAAWALRVRVGTAFRADIVRQLILAALPLGLILVINGLYFKIDAFLLSLLSTSGNVAVYGIAYRVFDLGSSLPGYVMLTLMPELARLEPREERAAALVQKAFTSMWLVVLPLSAFALCSPEIMSIIGGRAYERGAPAMALVIGSLALACLNGVFGNALVAHGRQAPLLKVSVWVLAGNVVLNLALIPPLGTTGAATALLATEALSLAMTARIYGRIAPVPRPQRPLRAVLATGAMIAAMCVKFLIPESFAALAAATVAGLVTYAVALYAVRGVPTYVADMVSSASRRLLRARQAT